MEKIKEFYLQRDEDETGISGTGVVARGVQLCSGKCVIEWLTFHKSIGVYDHIDDLVRIHGHGGKTKVMIGSPGDKKKAKEHKVDE